MGEQIETAAAVAAIWASSRIAWRSAHDRWDGGQPLQVGAVADGAVIGLAGDAGGESLAPRDAAWRHVGQEARAGVTILELLVLSGTRRGAPSSARGVKFGGLMGYGQSGGSAAAPRAAAPKAATRNRIRRRSDGI